MRTLKTMRTLKIMRTLKTMRLLLLVVLASVLSLVSGASAQTTPSTLLYDSATNSDFAAAHTGAAGAVLVGPLTNVDSSSWSTGGGSLTGTSAQNQFTTNHLEMLSQVISDQRIVATTKTGESSLAIYWLNLDYQSSDKSNYVLQVNADGSAAHVWRFNGTTQTQIATFSTTGYTAADVNVIDFWRVGAYLHWVITDQNTSAIVATGSVTDTAPLPATGSPGFIGSNALNTNTQNNFPRVQVFGAGGTAATAYTASASASSSLQSAPVTLTLAGNGATVATVTPSVTGVTGTFTPATVTLNGTASVTIVFQAATSGTATLSFTNGSGLANPTALALTVTPAPSGQVVCSTDSLTAGAGASSSATSYPSDLAALLGQGWSAVNNGVSGRKVSTVLPTDPQTAVSLYDSAKTTHVACLFGLTNDIGQGTETPAVLYARYVSWCGVWRAAGYKTVAFTVPHFAYGAGQPRSGSALFDPVADAVNALIRSNWRSFADALVDIASDPRFADETNQAVRSSDNGHFNDAGYAILAGQAQAAVYQAASGGTSLSTAPLTLTATAGVNSEVLTWTPDSGATNGYEVDWKPTSVLPVAGQVKSIVAIVGAGVLTWTDTSSYRLSQNGRYNIVGLH